MRMILLSLLFFPIYFNVSFQNWEEFTTARILFVILVFYVFLVKKKNILKIFFDPWVVGLFAITVFASIQSIFSYDAENFLIYIYLIIYSFITPKLIILAVNEKDKIPIAFILAIFLQAVVLVISFLNLEFRSVIGGLINMQSNVGFDNPFRPPPFAGYDGSALAIAMSMSNIAMLYILHNRKSYNINTVTLCLLAVIIINIASLLTGRMGFVLAIALYASYFLLNKKFVKNITALLFFIVTFFILISNVENAVDNKYFSYVVNNTYDIFSSDNESLHGFLGQKLPKLDIDTIFGTGRRAMVDGKNPSGHDSGIVQLYYSGGIILAFMFYASYLYFIKNRLKSIFNCSALFLAIPIFLIEIKEPYVFKYAVVFSINLLYYLSVYNRQMLFKS